MSQMIVTTCDYTDSRGRCVARKVTAGGDVRWSYGSSLMACINDLNSSKSIPYFSAVV